jgi:hypothetical protein
LGLPAADPDFEDPGIPERRTRSVSEAMLGLTGMIAALGLLQLIILVGILTAVLSE